MHFPPVVFAVAFAALVVALTALARRLPVPTPILQVRAGFLVGLVPGVAIAAARSGPRLLRLPAADSLGGGVLHVAARLQARTSTDRAARRSGSCSADDGGRRGRGARVSFPTSRGPWRSRSARSSRRRTPSRPPAIVSRLPVPRRVITMLEGESLVNDASALVLYRSAVAAAVTGMFSWGESIVRFFIDAGVGVLVGLLVGWLIVRALRWHEATRSRKPLLTLAGTVRRVVRGGGVARLGRAGVRGGGSLPAAEPLDRGRADVAAADRARSGTSSSSC